MSVDVSKIKKGDRVRVSLYGLPESDWLPVVESGDGFVYVGVPDGDHIQQDAEDHDITAHEPAAPALPDWWGSQVILGPIEGHGVFIGGGYVFPLDSTCVYGPDEFEGRAVSVVVDRDGNQPAEDKFARMWNSAKAERDEARSNYSIAMSERKEVEVERDAARDDARAFAGQRDDWQFRCEAFRAKVAKVRDDWLGCEVWASRSENKAIWKTAAARLSAILDGTDQ